MEWISQLGATSRERVRIGVPGLCLLLTLGTCLTSGDSSYSQETYCQGSIPYVKGCQRFCPNYCNGLGSCFVQGGCSQYSCLPRDLYGCSPQGGVLPPPEFFRHVQVSRANQEMADPMPQPAPRQFEEVPSQPIIVPRTPTPRNPAPQTPDTPSAVPQLPSPLPRSTSPDAAPDAAVTPAPEIPSPQPTEAESADAHQGSGEPIRLPARLADRRHGSHRNVPQFIPEPTEVAGPESEIVIPLPAQTRIEPLETFPQATAPDPREVAIPQFPPAVIRQEVVATPPTGSSPAASSQEQEYYLVIEGSKAEGNEDAAPPLRPRFIRPAEPAPATTAQQPISTSQPHVVSQELEPAESSLPAVPPSLRVTQQPVSVSELRAPEADADAAPRLPLIVGSVTPTESDRPAPELFEEKTTLRVRNIGPTAVRPAAIVTGVKGCSYQEHLETQPTSSQVTNQVPVPPSLNESDRTSLRVISVR